MSTDNVFIEVEDQAENEHDLETDALDFSSAVVSSTDWTTETIINQINKNNIELNPEFQRRDAWSRPRKSNFIESLILGLPIPQLVLAERKDKRGAYIVLDGKQRLLSIRQFASDKDDKFYRPLKLLSLEIRKDLNGKGIDDLRNDPLYVDDISSFENQPIRTIVIKNWPSEEFLYHVFLRLNTGSVQLAPQELRQALHPGLFVSYIDKVSSDNSALREILKIDRPDFRMRDNELLLRHIAFKNFIEIYSGNLKAFLDNACKSLNSSWDITEPIVQDQIENFNLAHERVKEIFEVNSYRKFYAGYFEVKFNRAIFDIMTGAFSIPDVRTRSMGREKEIKNAFQELCTNNYEFLSSIETTTKSLTSTYTRFHTWYTKINEILGGGCPTITLIDNRIKLG
ncbi:DUF262 domain-containing protein [Serratia quinivorans]|uniref:DUF262 domain-containing protein n=1 Tax=Serratia quinivorans TaxID=137545 RepID=UPI00217764EA|nr:DUF262 domain-containing protein [Serratia quinivorans]CAI0827772.1 Uncharacterized conserved protein [Serratia quinivorans]